jgi:hypothetical protein
LAQSPHREQHDREQQKDQEWRRFLLSDNDLIEKTLSFLSMMSLRCLLPLLPRPLEKAAATITIKKSMFAQRMNATTISIDTSHASYVAHPDEIAQLILDAAAAAQPQGNNPG